MCGGGCAEAYDDATAVVGAARCGGCRQRFRRHVYSLCAAGIGLSGVEPSVLFLNDVLAVQPSKRGRRIWIANDVIRYEHEKNRRKRRGKQQCGTRNGIATGNGPTTDTKCIPPLPGG